MKKIFIGLITVILFVWTGYVWSANAGEQRFADLGDFRLVSGETIKDCRIGFRTFGKLNPEKTNAVVMLTWLTGTTEELELLGYIGPGKMLDPSMYYVIAIDALGNGVSSSPSNSTKQPWGSFPVFTVRDMVNTQHELLSKHLGITRVLAVAGISMGGMQVMEFMISYPGFMDKAITINATPWVTSADLLAFNAEAAIIDAGIKKGASNDEIIRALTPLHAMLSWTPLYRAANTKPGDIDTFIAETEKILLNYNAFNWKWQLKAISAHNILKNFGDSPEKLASAVKAKALIITSKQDYCVYPEPSRTFAPLIKAATFELSGECGHFSFICEQDKIAGAVRSFLLEDGKKPSLNKIGK